jgi:hypothetical protein
MPIETYVPGRKGKPLVNYDRLTGVYQGASCVFLSTIYGFRLFSPEPHMVGLSSDRFEENHQLSLDNGTLLRAIPLH